MKIAVNVEKKINSVLRKGGESSRLVGVTADTKKRHGSENTDNERLKR